mmetsp:Transcript_46781/g.110154  ORF Transcript_46781/g.110154 Transcript_46781/m.110154 type:complete len:105 (+) Transcript_46781:273-587(+)
MSVIRLVSAFENKSQASPGVLESPVRLNERHWSLMASSAFLSATGTASMHASATAAKRSKKLVPAEFLPTSFNLEAGMIEQSREAEADVVEVALEVVLRTSGER